MRQNIRFVLAAFLLLLFGGLLSGNGSGTSLAAAPTGSIWRDVNEGTIHSTGSRPIIPLKYRVVAADVAALNAKLAGAPLESSYIKARNSQVIISLPLPDGGYGRYSFVEAPVMAPGLASRYPMIKTYLGQGIDDKTASVRFDRTQFGFHAMILSASGTIFIDPYQRNDTTNYISYYKSDDRQDPADIMREIGVDSSVPQEALAKMPLQPSGSQLRTYRLALAADGEYTIFYGGTVQGAMAGMVTTLNRVDGVYEREVAVRMVLVENDDLLIYTDPTTDPYTNNDGGAMLSQNQANLDAVIGNANYDIGHVFSTGGGGIAGLGVVCRTGFKAEGVTGGPSPIGDGFDIDYVAHEMGHEYGANHTFNGTDGSCGGGNRSPNHAYEPGSGSTIMAYAGICAPEDLQAHSDDYFHTDSFDAIVNYTTVGQGNSCAVVTATGNQPPTVDAGIGYTIPISTPFKLNGSANDPDGDGLTYDWEQFDLGAAAPPDTDNGNRAIFRSFYPVPVPYRYVPQLTDILSNTLTFGEAWPTTNRNLTFRLTARDNRGGGGGVNYATTVLTVTTSSGPFRVTSQNTATSWASGSTQTVTWDVANTTAAPVSCSNVNILLSVDRGVSFPTLLASGTANDGSEQITVPNISTSHGRVLVGCASGIFLDINNADITITGGPSPTTTNTSTPTHTGTPTNTVPPTITPGGPSLTPTNTRTPQPTATQVCNQVTYHTVTGTATMIMGGQDIGNHIDDGSTTIGLPFPVTMYGTAYTSGSASSNGHFELASQNDGPDEGCLPLSGDTEYRSAIIPLNEDLRTDETTTEPSGIFTQTLGTAPSREFVIRWHTTYFNISGEADFEVIFHEDSQQIDVVYGPTADAGSSGASGIQRNLAEYTSFSCIEGTLTDGLKVSYIPASCGTATATPSPTPTLCPIQFTDVPEGSTFYLYVRCLACRGIVTGYADNTFRPGNNVTRGQLSKIVSNSAGFSDPQTTQMFQDVPVGDTFQVFIGRLASRGFISGYLCGGPGEPCEPGNLPYFRPNNNATRGQISKIDSNAAGFNDTPTGQQFEDIAVGSTFYTYTYRLATRSILGGYNCGGPGEPCGPGNLPYFRPNNNATRGQTSKIVANTFFPDCQTPARK